MAKPATRDGYSNQHTIACERVLVTLLRGLGPWKDSVNLIGGLTPRYLIPTCPPEVPEHAGTLDVDIVIDVQILTETVGTNTATWDLASPPWLGWRSCRTCCAALRKASWWVRAGTRTGSSPCGAPSSPRFS